MIKKFVNADIKHLPWLTGYLAIVMGGLLTFVVQSSSVFTSTLTPLVGLGLIDVDRMYPMVIGSNLGTTSTALIAAFASGKTVGLQIALCHFFFNLSGILAFFPIPLTRIPLPLCKLLGRTVARYRWFAIFYLAMMFFVLPVIILGLSVIPGAGVWPLIVLGVPVFLVLILALAVKAMQVNCPDCLPEFLRNWSWLPRWMRSLEPLDDICMFVLKYICICCPKFYQSLKAAPPTRPVTLVNENVEDAVVTNQPRPAIEMKDVSMSHVGHDNLALDVSERPENYI